MALKERIILANMLFPLAQWRSEAASKPINNIYLFHIQALWSHRCWLFLFFPYTLQVKNMHFLLLCLCCCACLLCYSHLQNTGFFVMLGALCCQQRENKIVRGDGAVKEWKGGTRWGICNVLTGSGRLSALDKETKPTRWADMVGRCRDKLLTKDRPN